MDSKLESVTTVTKNDVHGWLRSIRAILSIVSVNAVGVWDEALALARSDHRAFLSRASDGARHVPTPGALDSRSSTIALTVLKKTDKASRELANRTPAAADIDTWCPSLAEVLYWTLRQLLVGDEVDFESTKASVVSPGVATSHADLLIRHERWLASRSYARTLGPETSLYLDDPRGTLAALTIMVGDLVGALPEDERHELQCLRSRLGLPYKKVQADILHYFDSIMETIRRVARRGKPLVSALAAPSTTWQPTCFACGAVGHISTKCTAPQAQQDQYRRLHPRPSNLLPKPDKKPPPKPPPNKKEDKVAATGGRFDGCSACGKSGHRKEDCHHKNKICDKCGR